jgi:2-oxoglutarate ferredoxin oxidoreductase subunit gamma
VTRNTVTEVRIAGFGGQGVVLAGVLLGTAALADGLFAVQSQSYGAEARGGAARSEVILSAEPILYPEVTRPRLMAAMSQAALDRYVGDLQPEGLLVVDAELVTKVPPHLEARTRRAAFTHVAGQELGKPVVANMAMLGFLVTVTEVVTWASLEQAVAAGVPRGTEGLNLKAVARGRQLAGAAT